MTCQEALNPLVCQGLQSGQRKQRLSLYLEAKEASPHHPEQDSVRVAGAKGREERHYITEKHYITLLRVVEDHMIGDIRTHSFHRDTYTCEFSGLLKNIIFQDQGVHLAPFMLLKGLLDDCPLFNQESSVSSFATLRQKKKCTKMKMLHFLYKYI